MTRSWPTASISTVSGLPRPSKDFEWVRRALGVTSWNVIGESYGTTVAMTLLAHHPASVRSAVLDSLNPPDAFFGMPWSQRVAHARDAFLAACNDDRRCKATTPDLPDIISPGRGQAGA